MRGNMWRIPTYRDFLDTESPVFKLRHIWMKQPKNVGQSPLFFPHIFTCESIRNISPKQDNSGTGCTCVYLDLFCDIPDILQYTWVYSPANYWRFDCWKTWLIPNNQNKTSFHSVWLEGGHERWRRRKKGNSY